MTDASSLPDDARAYIERHNALIEAAAAKRQGLSGQRDWKRPTHKPHGFGRAPLEVAERNFTEGETRIIRHVLAHGPNLARDVARGTGLNTTTVRALVIDIVSKCERRRIPVGVKACAGKNGYGRQLYFPDPNAITEALD